MRLEEMIQEQMNRWTDEQMNQQSQEYEYEYDHPCITKILEVYDEEADESALSN